MRVVESALDGVAVLEPTVYRDARGSFFESYNQRTLAALGITAAFVQDNQSRSQRQVLRGLHYQIRQPQGKLVRALAGEIYDVAVDLRRRSPSFGKWFGTRLSAENCRSLWVPAGFAHGFLVLSDSADVLYKTTDYYAPEQERCIRWDDPAIGVAWPLTGAPILSTKDAAAVLLAAADYYP
jgi:dTDP-4-dehydrorhamnose 3,5-epimerase